MSPPPAMPPDRCGASADEPEFRATRLDVHPSAFVAPGAVLVGEVQLGERASVWYGCVVRGDLEPIRIGAESNVQDLTVVHVDRGYPVDIGARVTIGHRAVVHGCRVEDGALVGMGAVVLTGAVIGRGALVAAGALVREGFRVPDGMLAAGVPARVIGPVGPTLRARIDDGVATYMACARAHRGSGDPA